MSDLYEQFKEWCEEHGANPMTISDEIIKENDQKCRRRLRKVIDGNVSLVGKCFKQKTCPYEGMFPEMWKYYKVISNYAMNEHEVSCLMFDEHPWYWFNYIDPKYYKGFFDFDGITVDSVRIGSNIFIDGIEDFVEITTEEFNKALNSYCKELTQLNWIPNHYRYGDKLPIDKDWEVPEDGD